MSDLVHPQGSVVLHDLVTAKVLVPQNLPGQVGGGGLDGVASLWHSTFHHNKEFELSMGQTGRMQVVQGAIRVNLVSYNGGPHDKDSIVGLTIQLRTAGEVLTVERNHFTLCRRPALDQDHSDMSLQQTPLLQIGDVNHQPQSSIPHADQGVAAENNGLCPIGADSELGKEEAGHNSLDDDTQNALEAHDNDGKWTLLGCGTGSVADSVLCLQREEETRGEIIDFIDTRPKVFVCSVVLVKVTVLPCSQVPNHRKEEPADEKGQDEGSQDPTPRQV